MKLLCEPEPNIAIFSFLLNFVWEFWQTPLYVGMQSVSHWSGIWTCTEAAIGDVAIALLSFWLVAAMVRSRRWLLDPGPKSVLMFTLAGVAITIAIEALSVRFGRWSYGESMPVLPILGTGLAPLLQWLLIPPLIVWFARRHVLGTIHITKRNLSGSNGQNSERSE